MILKLECDPTTGLDDLNGTGPATVGDWLTGTPYPILDGEAVYGVSNNTSFLDTPLGTPFAPRAR